MPVDGLWAHSERQAPINTQQVSLFGVVCMISYQNVCNDILGLLKRIVFLKKIHVSFCRPRFDTCNLVL